MSQRQTYVTHPNLYLISVEYIRRSWKHHPQHCRGNGGVLHANGGSYPLRVHATDRPIYPRVTRFLEQHAVRNVFDLSLDVLRAVRHAQRHVHEVHPHQNGVPRRGRFRSVQSVHVANEYPLGAENRLPVFQNAGEEFLVRVMLQPLQVEAVHSPLQPNFNGRRHEVLRHEDVVDVARCERFVLRIVQRRRYRGQRFANRLKRHCRRHCLLQSRGGFVNVSSLAHRFVRFIRLLRGHGLVVQGLHERVQGQIEDQAHVSTVSLAHERGEIVQGSQFSV